LLFGSVSNTVPTDPCLTSLVLFIPKKQ